MINTHHAQVRMQQRSIPPLIINWLEAYGEEATAPHGARVLYFGKESRKQIRGEVGATFYKKIKSLLNVYQIVCGDSVVTVGHRHKNKKIYLKKAT